MRVISGRFKGVALTTPKQGTRPTTDRTKEAIFSHLDSWGVLDDARVLDLFAGTGALGLEAMSRGAAFAAFVDDGIEARGLIRTNIDALGLGGATRVLRRDATRLGPAAPLFEPFTLVFADPPYGKGLAEHALAAARAGGWIAPDAMIVVEEAADAAMALPDGFDTLDRRRYDETEFVFARAV